MPPLELTEVYFTSFRNRSTNSGMNAAGKTGFESLINGADR